MLAHDSGPRWCATPFLCGSLIRYSLPVYPGAFLDHFIRPHQHIRRNRQADLLRRFEIDDEFKLCRLLHGKVGGLGTLQDLVHICSGTPVQVDNVRAVAHKTPSLYIIWKGAYRWEPVLCRELRNLFSLKIHYGARQHEDSLRTPLACGSKCRLNILWTSYV